MTSTTARPHPTGRFRVLLNADHAQLLEERARLSGVIPSALARALVVAGLRDPESPLEG